MKIEKLILPVLGFIFAGIGAALLWYFVPLLNQAAARIEGLAPLTAVLLANSPPGQIGLIEGRISERNRTQFRLFVAYVRYEYQGEDDDGDSQWVEDERVTPPLLLDLPGGRVQLENSDYDLQGDLIEWLSEPNLTWDRLNREGTKSYRGFERGNPVLAVGAIVQGATGRELRAEWLYRGTRTEYIEDQRSSTEVASWIGWDFVLIGAVAFSLGMWLWVRWDN